MLRIVLLFIFLGLIGRNVYLALKDRSIMIVNKPGNPQGSTTADRDKSPQLYWGILAIYAFLAFFVGKSLLTAVQEALHLAGK